MAISVIRTVLLYIIIIFAVRMMGKRQISEMQTSELVITLLMSNIASIPMQDTDQSMFSGIIPIFVLLVCEIAVSYLMLRKSKIRKILCGKPVVIINDGVVDRRAMTELRLSTEELFEQLRQKDVFALEDVAYAVIETNGKLSVMRKPDSEPPTSRQLGIKPPHGYIQAVVISDGELADYSLNLCGFDREWVYSILKSKKIKLKDVFIMTCDKTGAYQIITK